MITQSDGIDGGRRRFLTTAATVVGGAGVMAATVPFISAMLPSARTKAIGGAVEVDISGLNPGERAIVEWRGKPVWILRRDDSMLSDLAALDSVVSDPQSAKQQQPNYAANQFRSIEPEYLVVIGVCTHLGCSPSYITRNEPHKLGDDWKGGFFCACHGSRFDLAGRVFKGVPAPANLVVPPYKFITPGKLLIGDDGDAV